MSEWKVVSELVFHGKVSGFNLTGGFQSSRCRNGYLALSRTGEGKVARYDVTGQSKHES